MRSHLLQQLSIINKVMNLESRLQQLICLQLICNRLLHQEETVIIVISVLGGQRGKEIK